ncbi:MAG: heavy metal translocating P-type ATPase metal-binding domain-containing protein [Saprospiraceae bacterium]|nr:heavy metal translocating P-type ATPase metal-binding domain-containing protein [Saprospiraceae bacterium]
MTSISQQNKCLHCGSDSGEAILGINNEIFCCAGCRSVYEILNQNKLCAYYTLNTSPGIKMDEVASKSYYAFLERQEIANKLIAFKDHEVTHVNFYIPQIHCSSCLWLLEKLPQLHKGIVNSRVHYFNKEVQIVFNHKLITLKMVAEILASIGYRPEINLDSIASAQNEFVNSSLGLKIGISGFCFGNIMMMSFADYLSIGTLEPVIYHFFRFLSVSLSLPVLFYCASDFFQSAWNGLKIGVLKIDLPISLAIIITFARSMYEIANQNGLGYLDSMSGIVFFMLVSRWIQSKTYQKIFYNKDYRSFFPAYVTRINDRREEVIDLIESKTNDLILVRSNEVIPVDGILSKGKAYIDYSFVNGESQPVEVKIGDQVFAGGRQVGSSIEVVLTHEFSSSKLISLWNNSIFRTSKGVQYDKYDYLASVFTIVVLSLGLLSGLYWYFQDDTQKMWSSIITVLIVACPCALLLTKNFTQGNISKILSINGFFIKNSDVLMMFNRINTIVFDKTGTLTLPHENTIQYEGIELPEFIKEEIASVIKQSSHPLSMAVYKSFGSIKPFEVVHFKEHIGLGIEAWVNDKHVKIGSSSFVKSNSNISNGSELLVEYDGKYIGKFVCYSNYRKNAGKVMSELSKKYKLGVLSGDNESEKPQVRNIMGESAFIKFNQDPINKLEAIKELQNHGSVVMMVGDGLNDAGAFKQSDLSVSVTDKRVSFTPACDSVIHGDRLIKLASIIKFIIDAHHTIYIIFALSILYNMIGLFFALQGILSPLIAAILMPLSSITIIGLSYLWCQKLAMKNELISTQ